MRARVVFDVDEGYEPPQGVVRVVNADDSGIVGGRWTLAEDPDAARDNPLDNGGVWFWGLFDAPLYPFLVVNVTLPNDAGAVRLKIPHGRGKKRGAVLEPGEVSRAVTADVAADQFGLSRATVVVDRAIVGTAELTPAERRAAQ